jgi:hypothetical protein
MDAVYTEGSSMVAVGRSPLMLSASSVLVVWTARPSLWLRAGSTPSGEPVLSRCSTRSLRTDVLSLLARPVH